MKPAPIRFLYYGLLGAVAIAAALPFTAQWWWVGSAAVHWQVHIAVAAALLCIPLKRHRRANVCAVWVMLIASVGPIRAAYSQRVPVLPDHITPTLRVMSANIGWWNRAHSDELLADLRQRNPDIVALIEVGVPTAAKLQQTWSDGNVAFLPFGNQSPGNTLVWSRYPIREQDFISAGPRNSIVVSLIIETPEPVRILAVHPFAPINESWPGWSTGLQKIAELVAAETLPVILMGDFNSTPYHPLFHHISASGVNLLYGRTPKTWNQPIAPFGVAIDHILASKHWHSTPVRAFHIADSDHRGVIADMALLPGTP